MSSTTAYESHQQYHHTHKPAHHATANEHSRPLTVSPVTGKPVPSYYLHASSVHFQDVHGRSVLLRGVNLSGAAKNPLKCPSQSQDRFWEDAEEGKCDFLNSSLNLDDGSAEVSGKSIYVILIVRCIWPDFVLGDTTSSGSSSPGRPWNTRDRESSD